MILLEHTNPRDIRKLARFSDMVVAYALPMDVMEDSVSFTFRKAELSSESELRRNAIMEKIESLHMNYT